MRMTPQQMDELINRHFGYEAADDVEGVLSSLADEVRHEVVPSPMGEQTDKQGIREFYRMLFADLKGEGVTPLRRLYGEEHEYTISTRDLLANVLQASGKSAEAESHNRSVLETRRRTPPNCATSPCASRSATRPTCSSTTCAASAASSCTRP